MIHLGRRGDELSDAIQQGREKALTRLSVSRETLARLDDYVALLAKWQKAINLVAPSSLGEVWIRHILDSSQIADLGAAHRTWADLGSGAGFPGLVIALLSRERSPATEVHLIESDRRKASFLREAIRVTQAPAIIHENRIENILGGLAGQVTAVTARALAPLRRLFDLAEPLLTTGTEGFFPKGKALESELSLASKLFEYEIQLVPSQTDENGRIVLIRNLRRHAASIGG
jgi:16S rRNA (guanine527-N7)-methyltransferase